ncbi:hypothetical protein G6F37_000499 [Rhizopus arrhizus]|nr:hypothetical protein G6F38_000074 [Rhizopus arrhizus]KAG1164209.1 hypothetical protein G6F37_000499 [Rhizopus arrhizus]
MAPSLGKIVVIYGEEKYNKATRTCTVTLLSSPPEAQYIALYNINLILQKQPEVLSAIKQLLTDATATAECDNADIRDRAYVYWHLLSTDPQAAKAVVLILTSVYHKSAEAFIAGKKYMEDEDINIPSPQIQATIKNNDIGNLLDLDWDEPTDEVPTSPILVDRN